MSDNRNYFLRIESELVYVDKDDDCTLIGKNQSVKGMSKERSILQFYRNYSSPPMLSINIITFNSIANKSLLHNHQKLITHIL